MEFGWYKLKATFAKVESRIRSWMGALKHTRLLVILLAVGALFSFLTLLYSTPNIKADELDDINSQIQQKEEEIQRLEQEIKRVLTNTGQAYHRLSQLQAQYKRLEDLSAEYNELLQRYTNEIDYQLSALKQEQKRLVIERTVFYLETQGNALVYILDASDVNDLVDRFTFISVIEYQGTNRLAQLYQEIAELHAKKQAIDKRILDLKEQMRTLKAEINNVRAEYRRLVALASQNRMRIKALTQEVEELSARAQEIIARKAAANLGADVTGGNDLPTYPVVEAEGQPGTYTVTVGDQTYQVQAPLVLSFKDNKWNKDRYFRVLPCSEGENGCRYYGGLLFRKDADVYVINFLPMHLYLYGLGEMPSSWNIEALKAQAIAGRTYAYRKIQAPRSRFYHIVDTVADQNYVGVNKLIRVDGSSQTDASNWKAAVDTTIGKILTVGGNPITAWYHSTCGGHTLSSAEVWGGARIYAVAKSDRHQDGDTWIAYDKDSPRFRWFAGDTPLDYVWIEDLIDATIYYIKQGKTKTAQNQVGCGPDKCVGEFAQFSKGNIKNLLGEDAISAKVGTISDIIEVYNTNTETIVKDTRLTSKLRIIGDKGEYILDDAQAFKLVYNIRSPGKDWIASTLFDIDKEGNIWKVYSYGFGHRVGLCQYGAQGRAQAGQNYQQILTHYYNGASIVDKYSIANIPIIKVGLQKAGADTTTIVATATFNIFDGSRNLVVEVPAGQVVQISR